MIFKFLGSQIEAYCPQAEPSKSSLKIFIEQVRAILKAAPQVADKV